MWSSRTGADRTAGGAAFSRSARAKKEVMEGWNCFLWRCDMASVIGSTVVWCTEVRCGCWQSL